MEGRGRRGSGGGGGQSTKPAKVFFQKQKQGTRCRMHALNNVLGRPAVDVNRFNAACDAFDARYDLQGSRHFFLLADLRSRPPSQPLDASSSSAASISTLRPPKNESEENVEAAETTVDERRAADGQDEPHASVVAEEGEREEDDDEEEEDGEGEGSIDVLSYILREQFKYRTRYIPMGGAVRRLDREELEQCEAFLSFSEGHVWANRRVGNTWYCLDSLQTRPTTIKPSKALASGLGHILVFAKSAGGATAESRSNPRGEEQSDGGGVATTETARAVKERKRTKRAGPRDASKPDPGGRTKGKSTSAREKSLRRGAAKLHAAVPDDAGSNPSEDDEAEEDGQPTDEPLTSTRNTFSCLGLDDATER